MTEHSNGKKAHISSNVDESILSMIMRSKAMIEQNQVLLERIRAINEKDRQRNTITRQHPIPPAPMPESPDTQYCWGDIDIFTLSIGIGKIGMN